MNRDEYERLKQAEKEHLRKLRDLKQQHREAQRKKGLLDALRNLGGAPELDETHDEMVRKLAEQDALAEARFELAAEEAEELAQREAARVELERLEAERKKAEAADLVRQMKAQMLGGAAEPRPESGEPEATLPPKTIGPAQRDTPAADAPDAPENPEAGPPKSIGRARPRSSDRD